jgi:hypothetical protein
MKVQTGPLLTIIAGFVIAAVGVFWHAHLARTANGAAPRGVVPNVELQPEEEGKTAGDIGVKSPGGDTSVGQDDNKNTGVDGNQQVDRPRETAMAQVEMPNMELKSSTFVFANEIRTFEQSYDSRREQIVGMHIGIQADREGQALELKALDAEKIAEFTKTFLPNAQFLQAELLRRLQQRGIDVAVPPPPRGISIALGRSILQLDIRAGGLPGYRPVHGLASYLEMLASNLPD